ncbi:fas apoptotic inhibitory molecule 3 isoform X2 [Ovis aries]|uniref:Fc mu receptor n=1 Tax=Ovis aries TaxID=9940 RepID=A0AC11DYB3_SHEEP|nr:fas apoptotic inhibitory molecule 3 isoform X2 [Ovis aries]
MDLWLWALYFLPVVGAPKVLPEVKMEGMLGGSITIECPLPETYVRIYLCRTIDKSGRCTTVVSSSKFVREEFKHRVTLEQYPDRNLFLVEMTALTKNDSGVYACGVGLNTDRGKTQQITLTVHSVTTPAQRTESPQAHQASPNPSVTHRPRVSRASSVATAEPTIFLQSITTSKTSAQEGLLRLQTASYNQQTRLHRQRGSNQDPGAASGMEDQGVFVLIPTILGLILLALLGLLAKRIVRRRKALSRRVRRLAVRMPTVDASQRARSQRPRVSRRPRTPSNIYSACPRRPRGVDAAGGGSAPPPGPGAPAASAPPQVPEIPWLPVPSLKIDCEYVSFCHPTAAQVEDTDSNDYVNVACLTHLSSCAPGPRPWCQ